MIRRLDPDADRGYFVDAWLWELETALWYREASKVFGPATFEDWIEASREDTRATFGVFAPDFIGVFILTLKAKGLYEVDFIVKPRCSVENIIAAGIKFRDAVFADLGAQEVFCWTPRKNYSTRKLCATLGFVDSGLRLLKGSYKNRVIEWQRLSITNISMAQQQAA